MLQTRSFASERNVSAEIGHMGQVEEMYTGPPRPIANVGYPEASDKYSESLNGDCSLLGSRIRT